MTKPKLSDYYFESSFFAGFLCQSPDAAPFRSCGRNAAPRSLARPLQADTLPVSGPFFESMRTLQIDPYAAVEWDAVERHTAQFHAHSSYPPTEGHSGSDPPDRVIDDYHAAGYSVLALTGHEYNITETTWPWTDWDRDPSDLGIVAVQAAELGGSEDGIDHDLVSLFCDLADTAEMSVDATLTEIGDRGGLAFFPHPGRYHEDGEWYVEHFRNHPHLLGVEVVNAADRYPTNRDTWDDLLGRLDGERPVWGFANDDYHGRDEAYTFDRSRNVLLLAELTERAVREALVDGRFFYQHLVDGPAPTVEAIHHDPDRGDLTIDATGDDQIQWVSDGTVLERGARLRYREVDDMGGYVRARLVAESGSETGTQPFRLTDE